MLNTVLLKTGGNIREWLQIDVFYHKTKFSHMTDRGQ